MLIWLPNVIAKPWLRSVPNTTPSNILKALCFPDRDKTRIWVLSPSSEKNIKIKDIIKVYKNCIKTSPINNMQIIYMIEGCVIKNVKVVWILFTKKEVNGNMW